MTNTTQRQRTHAPVQGWPAGIPWSLHLEAYAGYCKKWRPQPSLIEGGCRGGFHVDELDEFIPGWRDRASEIVALRARIAQLEGKTPVVQPDDTLAKIAEVAACFGDDWPDVEGEPEVLRRVKWAARQLKAAQERAPLTDERIQEIDDETHFHESPGWPMRFARAIEADVRKKPAP